MIKKLLHSLLFLSCPFFAEEPQAAGDTDQEDIQVHFARPINLATAFTQDIQAFTNMFGPTPLENDPAFTAMTEEARIVSRTPLESIQSNSQVNPSNFNMFLISKIDETNTFLIQSQTTEENVRNTVRNGANDVYQTENAKLAKHTLVRLAQNALERQEVYRESLSEALETLAEEPNETLGRITSAKRVAPMRIIIRFETILNPEKIRAISIVDLCQKGLETERRFISKLNSLLIGMARLKLQKPDL